MEDEPLISRVYIALLALVFLGAAVGTKVSAKEIPKIPTPTQTATASPMPTNSPTPTASPIPTSTPTRTPEPILDLSDPYDEFAGELPSPIEYFIGYGKKDSHNNSGYMGCRIYR